MSRFITVIRPDGSEHRLTGDDLPLTVGSGSECDVFLPDSDEVAAYIGDAQGHLFVQPAGHGDRPLFHNDRLLTGSAWLKSRDSLASGSATAHCEMSGDRVVLRVVESAGDGRRPPLQPPREPPPGAGTEITIPVTVEPGRKSSGRTLLLALIALGFVLLGGAALFVLLARPVTLDITPEPDRASLTGGFPAVRIGGRYLVLPGSYTLTAVKEGYERHEQELVIGAGSPDEVRVQLTRLPGILELILTPADGVAVYAGAELIHTTPPGRLRLAPGRHRLTLTRERYRSLTADIDIEGRERVQELRAVLEPDWAAVTITSDPPGAEVFIDGAAAGTTPLTTELLSGDHLVELRKDLHADVSRQVRVEAGVDAAYDLPLPWLPARLTLTSTPGGAAVSVGDEYFGTTPVTLELAARAEHRLKLSAPGYLGLDRTVTLEPGEEAALRLELEQERGDIFLTTTPVDAVVTIDGEGYDGGPGRIRLSAEPHEITVSAPGYRPVTRTVTPRPGFSRQVVIDLVPEQGTAALPTPAAEKPAGPLKTGAGHELIEIVPAPFTMGAPRREPGRRANERLREVTMQRPYLMAAKLVTNGEFRAFDPSHDAGAVSGYSLNGDDQPVVNVTWNEAAAYLNWLSVQDGLPPFYRRQGDTYAAVSPPSTGYRLPTEAEWAFAARVAGADRMLRFPWPGTFPPRAVMANFADESARAVVPRVIQGYDDGFPVTSPVGSFAATNGGFFDLAGNASEWCHDYYTPYTGSLDRTADPFGPPAGTHKVIRGSNWRDGTVSELRLSYRGYHKEGRDSVSFRVARYP